MIRKLGTFVEFSVMREPVTADWTIIGDTKELNIHGSHLSPYTYPIAIDMLSKGLVADGSHHDAPTALDRLSRRYGSGCVRDRIRQSHADAITPSVPRQWGKPNLARHRQM